MKSKLGSPYSCRSQTIGVAQQPSLCQDCHECIAVSWVPPIARRRRLTHTANAWVLAGRWESLHDNARTLTKRWLCAGARASTVCRTCTGRRDTEISACTASASKEQGFCQKRHAGWATSQTERSRVKGLSGKENPANTQDDFAKALRNHSDYRRSGPIVQARCQQQDGEERLGR